MKLTKAEEKKLSDKLKHIVGACMCQSNSKTCAYWKNVDSKDDEWQVKEIIKEIKKL